MDSANCTCSWGNTHTPHMDHGRYECRAVTTDFTLQQQKRAPKPKPNQLIATHGEFMHDTYPRSHEHRTGYTPTPRDRSHHSGCRNPRPVNNAAGDPGRPQRNARSRYHTDRLHQHSNRTTTRAGGETQKNTTPTMGGGGRNGKNMRKYSMK